MTNAISTRIRFARNLADEKFLSVTNQEENRKLLLKIKETAKTTGEFDFIDMASLDEIHAGELVEKHLISPELVQKKTDCGVLLGRNGKTSIMINEEDHLRIQVIISGYHVKEAFEEAKKVDEALDKKLKFAYSDELGYLTHCPSNLGTAMRASVMLHLPALTETGGIGKLPNFLAQYGFTVRGLYGEGSRYGGKIYQISNQVSLGISEEEIISRLSEVIEKVVESEKSLREKLFEKIQISDRVFRAIGTLSYAKIMTSEEALLHLSDLRFGVEAGVIEADFSVIDELIYKIQPYSSEIIAKGQNRDISRAEYIKKSLEKMKK